MCDVFQPIVRTNRVRLCFFRRFHFPCVDETAAAPPQRQWKVQKASRLEHKRASVCERRPRCSPIIGRRCAKTIGQTFWIGWLRWIAPSLLPQWRNRVTLIWLTGCICISLLNSGALSIGHLCALCLGEASRQTVSRPELVAHVGERLWTKVIFIVGQTRRGCGAWDGLLRREHGEKSVRFGPGPGWNFESAHFWPCTLGALHRQRSLDRCFVEQSQIVP